MRSGRGSLGVTLFTVAVVLAAGLLSPASAHGQPQAWTGRYQMVTYASQKAGTSPASRQKESDFGATFTLSTTCSAGSCVATVVDGPAPSNPTIPQPMRYVWSGSEWASTYDWVWDCFLGDGNQKAWSPATSWAFYASQPDGSLRGTWHTDIAQGPCRGSVVMPVAAVPA
ncbi:Rv2253 family sensor-like surface protein [Mycolicibacterium sp. CBM1]